MFAPRLTIGMTGSVILSLTMKARVTITIDKDLLRSAERRGRRRSRSQVIEDALRDSERTAIARETIEYYRSLSPGEREEDASWGELAAAGAAATWEELPRAARHRGKTKTRRGRR